MDSNAARDALHAELLLRCGVLVEFDAPQAEAFVSGLFATLPTDDEMMAFVDHCRDAADAVAATVVAIVASLDGGQVGRAARSAFDAMASQAPPLVAKLGRSRLIEARRVEAPFGSSVVLACGPPDEAADHAVLVEIDDGRLVDLRLSGDPADVLDAGDLADRLTVTTVDLDAAVALVGDAWRAAHGVVEPTGDLLANQWLVRARLRSAGEGDLPIFDELPATANVQRDMSPAEAAAADAAALSTLTSALGAVEPCLDDEAWRAIFHAAVPGLTSRERDGLLWLEWADWLGVAIGLSRGRDDARELDGSVFVDLVNRCPEVSSTISRDDRDYAIWSFDVALDHLRDEGLVVDGTLDPAARSRIHGNFAAIWAP